MCCGSLSGKSRVLFFLLTSWILLALCADGRGAATEGPGLAGDASLTGVKGYRPYCGLFCLYSVMRMAGADVDILELIRPEYIGSKKGSSLVELKQAAEDHGMYAEPVNRLTAADLKRLNYPLILHVKSNMEALAYDHYELFLGMEGDKLRLLNPPEPLQLVPFRELTPRWAGNGLLLSTQPIDVKSVLAPGRRQLAIRVVVALTAILGVHGAKRWVVPAPRRPHHRTLLRLSIIQALICTLLALGTGFAYHFVRDAGLLSHPRAAEAVQRAHQGTFIPKVSMKTVRRSLGNGTIFVDARLARDFEMGHLEDAINVPVDANDGKCQQAMAHIVKDASIIVYCQSRACKFAETVAIKLVDWGFVNVSIYRGGWREWEAANGNSVNAAVAISKGTRRGV